MEKTKFYEASFEALKESDAMETKAFLEANGVVELNGSYDLEVCYIVEKNIYNDRTGEYEHEDVYTKHVTLEEAYKRMLKELDNTADWCSKNDYEKHEKSYVSVWKAFELYKFDEKGETCAFSADDTVSIYSVYIEPMRKEDCNEIAEQIINEMDIELIEDYEEIVEAFEDYYIPSEYQDGGRKRSEKWFNNRSEAIQKMIIAIDEVMIELDKCETTLEYINKFDAAVSKVRKVYDEIVNE